MNHEAAKSTLIALLCAVLGAESHSSADILSEDGVFYSALWGVLTAFWFLVALLDLSVRRV